MIFSRSEAKAAVHAIAELLLSELGAGKNVLWLVSGGSAIEAQVSTLNTVKRANPDALASLTILPIDERFGAYGHEASNSAQMRQAGFAPEAATWIDILEGSPSFEQAARSYANHLSAALASAQMVVATLGLGPDAHTAGLLPHSPAVSDTTSEIVAYSWTDYTRLTTGIAPFKHIDIAFVLAYGETKKRALERLHANVEVIEELPSKVLYEIPSVTVYNDFIESEGDKQ